METTPTAYRRFLVGRRTTHSTRSIPSQICPPRSQVVDSKGWTPITALASDAFESMMSSQGLHAQLRLVVDQGSEPCARLVRPSQTMTTTTTTKEADTPTMNDCKHMHIFHDNRDQILCELHMSYTYINTILNLSMRIIVYILGGKCCW
jgi:hypothetical protein